MPMWLRRLWIQLTADPKRLGVLCTALLLGLLLWTRLIVVSNPPRTAVADDPVAEKSEKPRADATKADAPETFGVREPVAIELSTAPERDPFVISPAHFPKPTLVTETAPLVSKSELEAVEDPLQVEARRLAQMRAAADTLKLEAAIGGSMAVINGKTYRAEQWIDQRAGESHRFRLVEVKQRSVILECNGRLFEVHMAGPRG